MFHHHLFQGPLVQNLNLLKTIGWIWGTNQSCCYGQSRLLRRNIERFTPFVFIRYLGIKSTRGTMIWFLQVDYYVRRSVCVKVKRLRPSFGSLEYRCRRGLVWRFFSSRIRCILSPRIFVSDVLRRITLDGSNWKMISVFSIYLKTIVLS